MELTFEDVTCLRPITRLALESLGFMGVPCSVLQDLNGVLKIVDPGAE